MDVLCGVCWIDDIGVVGVDIYQYEGVGDVGIVEYVFEVIVYDQFGVGCGGVYSNGVGCEGKCEGF